MQDCRATLGTESGSNVFDDDGHIQQAVERAFTKDPATPYDIIHARYLARHEGKIRMNQISPRVFEAISLETALVLFEGEYSGIIEPGVHYIPLKKDFGNVDDVLSKLADNRYLEAMVKRAYEDVIESRQYSYKAFVEMVSGVISRRVFETSVAESVADSSGRSNVSVQNEQRLSPLSMKNLPSFFTKKHLPPNAINPPVTVRHVARLLRSGNPQTVRKFLGNALLCHPAARNLADGLKRCVKRFLLPLRKNPC
jgi:hypothetical protein